MLWNYIGEVFRRAWSPAPRVTDALQVLAASALPAVGKFAGLNLPQTADSDALAYIGLAALSYIAIRLVWAPYSLWKDQKAEIKELRSDLSKPERLIIERLADHRAEARATLAGKLEDYQTLAYYEDWSDTAKQASGAQMSEIRHLQARAGLSDNFESGWQFFLTAVKTEGSVPNTSLAYNSTSKQILTQLQKHLVGDLCDSELEQALERLKENYLKEMCTKSKDVVPPKKD
jgi:hypothetical protein